MTKSKTTKLTALLLALVLVTSCFVGGTLARYVTSTSSEDSARVAVWGINADEVEMDLFDATYTVNGVTVAQSEDGDNIIAPGTEKDNFFSIVNLDDNLKPEVMYEVAINLDDSEIDPLILNNPSIVWRLDEGTYGTWEETKAQVLALSGDASGVKTYAPLEIAENFKSGKTHKIGWKWIMDNNNNEMDTAMGNKAATDGDISAKISIKVTATQVNIDTTGMLDGNGQVYDVSNPTPLVFRSAAPVDELQSVEVNGEEITQGTDYTVSSGSTVITLSDTYLASLETGNYTISIISDNMTANASFKIKESINLELQDTPIIHNEIIPEGGVYYSGMELTNGEYYAWDYDNATKYTAGQPFPEIKDGDVYFYGDYEYRYNAQYTMSDTWYPSNLNGWGAAALLEVRTTKTEFGELLTTINNKDLISLEAAFGHASYGGEYDFTIEIAPQIPNTVTIMTAAFTGCTNLRVAPTIPSSVTSMSGCFEACPKLSGTIKINANPTNYEYALYGTQITEITGTCSEETKQLLLNTKNN